MFEDLEHSEVIKKQTQKRQNKECQCSQRKRKILPFALNSDVSPCEPENSLSINLEQESASLSASDPEKKIGLIVFKSL